MAPDPDLYRPLPLLRGGHLETIVPTLLGGKTPLPPSESRVVPVAEGSAVRIEVHLPSGPARGTVLVVHGMGGSADSRYVRATAAAALGRGYAAVRMNLRTCGGTEALARTLYNAGQGDDAGAVLRHMDAGGLPRPYLAVGFSLGGNLVLRYAGTAGADCLADAVAGVNAPLDLERCCREMERPGNALYLAYFVGDLCAHLRRVRRVRPVPGPPAWPWAVRTVRRFDALFTAPGAGFPSAEAYYAAASAGPRLPGTAVRTLVLNARNDPFVPVADAEAVRGAAPRLRVVLPDRGGHVGWTHSGRPRFWAASAVLDFLESGT